LYNGIILFEFSYDELSAYRGNHLSMIFQEPMTSLIPVLTIRSQMNEILMPPQGMNEESATKKSIEMLHAVGIVDPELRINDYPHPFSGGMRPRIMIAMSLQCLPALLIADEPTTALDVTIPPPILDLMMELKDKRDDAAILLITHDLAVIAETCDRVIVMSGGVIQEIAPIDELFKNPIHPYPTALMESIPKMDIKEKRLKALKGMLPSILELLDASQFCSRFYPPQCACNRKKVEPELIEISRSPIRRVNLDVQ
jgi:oligopeptide/dipeptide ABC transporter, ATP-binding protein, C-terminal domain